MSAAKAARYVGQRRWTTTGKVGDAAGKASYGVPGINSPEQPDLMQIGRATAQGGSERQRGLGEQPGESGRDQEMVMARARQEQSDGGATIDSATRYGRRTFGVALAGGIPG